MKAVTPQEKLFLTYYGRHLDPVEAARLAGFKDHKTVGPKLMKQKHLQEALSVIESKRIRKVELTAELTLNAIRRVLTADIRRMVDEDGNLKPVGELHEDEAALVVGFDTIIKNAEAGDGHTDKVLKYKLVDRARYVEMAAKHFKLLTDITEHKGLEGLAERIRKAKFQSESVQEPPEGE